MENRHGLTLQLSYTYGHEIDIQSGDLGSTNQQGSGGLSPIRLIPVTTADRARSIAGTYSTQTTFTISPHSRVRGHSLDFYWVAGSSPGSQRLRAEIQSMSHIRRMCSDWAVAQRIVRTSFATQGATRRSSSPGSIPVLIQLPSRRGWEDPIRVMALQERTPSWVRVYSTGT